MKKNKFIKIFVIIYLTITIIEISTISFAKYIYEGKNVTAGFININNESGGISHQD